MNLPEEILTDRLLLRRYRFSDVDDVFDYAQDPEWGKFLPVPAPYKKADAEWFISHHLLKDQNKENQWAIEVNGRVVGGIDFNFVTSGFEIGEFHWSVGRAFWGTGIMTEAALAVRDIALKNVPQLHRIQSFCDLRNVGSWRVMEKIGMTREGIKRKTYKAHDSWDDTVHYALLREDLVIS